MDPDLALLLTDTVQVAPFLGQDGYGKPTWGPPVSTPCRIERHFQTLPTGAGPLLVEETRVFFDGNVVLESRSQVTFPDGATPPIAGIKPVKDVDGSPHHLQVYF